MRQGARVRIVLCAVVITVGAVVSTPVAEAQSAPAPEAGSSDWRQVSGGEDHTCGVRTSGRLYCWGDDSEGQLGDGLTNADQATPVEVLGGFTNWISVSAGSKHTCARRAPGRLYCWGEDAFGGLGDGGSNTAMPVPTLVAGGFTDWTSVTAGGQHTCGRRATGQLYCWGFDGSGAVGDGGIPLDRSIPTLVAGGATNWTAVATGDGHSCGRRATGRIYCWGNDSFGQLGDSVALTDRHTPTLVAGGFTNWAMVADGAAHTCARRTTGRLYCWGADTSGQLGDGGANTQQPMPVQVAGGAVDWTTAEGSGSHTCARRSTGRLYCWGHNFFGQGGHAAGSTATTPTQVAGGATDWAVVTTGAAHSCGRTTTGRLFCWGADLDGQLGDGGTNTNQPAPVEVYAP